MLDSKRIGTIASINVSRGGVPKRPVTAAQVLRNCIDGDAQNDRIHHGGAERAVCLYSLELIEALKAEGHPIGVGTTGENVTVRGIGWERVMPGVRVRVGPVLLEVTAFTTPCHVIKRSFTDERFVRISQKLYPGWSRVYAKVLEPGEIRTGDAVEVLLPTA